MSFINLERKGPVGKTCRFCGKSGLKWIKCVDTRSGVELGEANGKPHICSAKTKSNYNSQIADFTNNCIVWESDSEEVKQKKIEWHYYLTHKGDKYNG